MFGRSRVFSESPISGGRLVFLGSLVFGGVPVFGGSPVFSGIKFMEEANILVEAMFLAQAQYFPVFSRSPVFFKLTSLWRKPVLSGSQLFSVLKYITGACNKTILPVNLFSESLCIQREV